MKNTREQQKMAVLCQPQIPSTLLQGKQGKLPVTACILRDDTVNRTPECTAKNTLVLIQLCQVPGSLMSQASMLPAQVTPRPPPLATFTMLGWISYLNPLIGRS